LLRIVYGFQKKQLEDSEDCMIWSFIIYTHDQICIIKYRLLDEEHAALIMVE
jgi:hypothetical protein